MGGLEAASAFPFLAAPSCAVLWSDGIRWGAVMIIVRSAIVLLCVSMWGIGIAAALRVVLH